VLDDDDNNEPLRIVPGQVRFDDKGNSVWVPPRERVPRTVLELVPEEPRPSRPSENPKGSRVGYNPYESGMLSKEKRRKTDLRALSKWIEMRKRMEGED
jgi:hypothetical protein